jgi:Ca-activated chloride channel family protein
MIQKGILLLVLLFASVDPSDIGKINSVKADAKKAYMAGDYKAAIQKYTYLTDSLGVREDEVMMNLANSYFLSNDTVNAQSSFQPLTMSKSTQMKSMANQQLGVLSNRQGKFEEALNYFKQALKADPANDDARFNYEMVKKKLEEQKKKEQEKNKDKQKDQQEKEDQKKEEQQKKDQEKKDQEKKDQESKEKQEQEKKEQEEKEKKEKERNEKDSEKEKKEQQKEIPPSVKEKLKEMDMSEEKAKMILEAMKNQEVQYLQQNKRKSSKQRDKSKPDW